MPYSTRWLAPPVPSSPPRPMNLSGEYGEAGGGGGDGARGAHPEVCARAVQEPPARTAPQQRRHA
eukprot:1410996-Pleurochrysis_carterae.AAC.1